MFRLESDSYAKELNDAMALAHFAGQEMLFYYDRDYEVSTKEGEASPESSIFTEVDGRIDSLVQEFLGRHWPDDCLLTEETEPNSDWFKSPRVWAVDPIDGTLGYKKKTGYFGISIALLNSGRPVVGVLFAPAQNLIGWAVKGEGTWLNGKKISRANDSDVTAIIASRNSANRAPYQQILSQLNPNQDLKLITTESVVYKALSMLQGNGEIYPILPVSGETKSAPKFWDIAAADLLLHEAGMMLTTWAGDEYRYDVPNFLCTPGVLMGTKAGHKYASTRLP